MEISCRNLGGGGCGNDKYLSEMTRFRVPALNKESIEKSATDGKEELWF
jgi:hypothetical protein